MVVAHRVRYSANDSARIGGLVPETVAVLGMWDPEAPFDANLARVTRENWLGRESRVRAKRLLAVMRRRYLTDGETREALRALVTGHFPREGLRSVLYFHTLRREPLLEAVVREIVVPFSRRGQAIVPPAEVVRAMRRWAQEGRTAEPWSHVTTQRTAQGMLTTLRDFGLLEGAAIKRVAPAHLPVAAFAYIAFVLHQEAPSGQRVLYSPAWELFFLTTDGVERLFVEAQQERLLEYHAAGSIIRLDFPAATLPEYARDLAQRAH